MNLLTKTLTKLFGGNKHDKDVRELQPIVGQINAEFAKLSALSHDELRAKTAYFRSRISEHVKDIDQKVQAIRARIDTELDMDPDEKEVLYQNLDELHDDRSKQGEIILNKLLPEAFAVVKETARRFQANAEIPVQATEMDQNLAVNHDFLEIRGDQAVYKNTWTAGGTPVNWDMLHYDVQLIGGMVLHNGKIAEMATGEGKTLVATLPAYLNGLFGQGVHIVTVNNYLAKRDSEWMGPIMHFLGLTVDCIDNYPPHSPERRGAYMCDITYGTNNEFGFDYLRDNMVRHADEMVQRRHHFAMVDEVDSVLVDDARTPLIISGPVSKQRDQEFEAYKPRILRLVEAQRKAVQNFLTDAKKLIDAGDTEKGGIALLRAFRGLPKHKALIKYLSETGVKQVLQKTENTYMQDNSRRMPEIDEELFFVIDEKNNSVEMVEKGIDLITTSGEDADFCVLPDVGAIMAEIDQSTADEATRIESKDKLLQDFSIKSERLHAVQQLLKAYTLFELDTEYVVMDGKVKIVDE